MQQGRLHVPHDSMRDVEYGAKYWRRWLPKCVYILGAPSWLAERASWATSSNTKTPQFISHIVYRLLAPPQLSPRRGHLSSPQDTTHRHRHHGNFQDSSRSRGLRGPSNHHERLRGFWGDSVRLRHRHHRRYLGHGYVQRRALASASLPVETLLCGQREDAEERSLSRRTLETNYPFYCADYWVKLFGTHVNSEGQKYVTTGQTSLIVSLLSVGTFFGALSGASFGDWIGRRMGLLGEQESESKPFSIIVPKPAPNSISFFVNSCLCGFHCGSGHANCSNSNPPLHRRTSGRRSGCRFAVCSHSSIPVRIGSEMDSRDSHFRVSN